MADETVGSLVVKLIFETNAGEVLGNLSAQSVLTRENLDKLLASGQQVPLVFNQSNQELAGVVETLTAARARMEPLRETWATVSQTATESATTFREVSSSGKEFDVVINKLRADEEAATGPVVSRAEAEERAAGASESAANAAATAARELEAEAAASKLAATAVVSSGAEQVGIMEELKGQIADVKLQIDRATDPARVRALTEELERLQAQLAGMKFGVFAEGAGTIQQLEARLKEARAELAALNIEMNPARANELNATIRIMERDLASMTGKGVVFARQEFRNLRFEHFAVQQAMISLLFVLNSFSTENSSSETKKMKQALEGALGTALTLQLALSALAPAMGPLLQSAVGLGIAALVGIIAYLNEADEAAKKAAKEGLKDFADAIKGLPTEEKATLKVGIEADIGAIDAAIKKIKDQAVLTPVTIGADVLSVLQNTPEELAQIKRLEDRKKILEESNQTLKDEILIAEARKAQEEATGKLVSAHLSDLSAVREEQKRLNDLVKEGTLFEQTTIDGVTKTVRVEDELETVRRREKDLLSSTNELLAERVRKAEDDYKLRQISVEQYRDVLSSSIELSTKDSERIAFAEKLKALNADVLTTLREDYETRKNDSLQYFTQLELLKGSTDSATQRLSIEKEQQTLLLERAGTIERNLKAGNETIDQARLETALLISVTDENGKQVLTKKQIEEVQARINELVRKQVADERSLREQATAAETGNIQDRFAKQAAAEEARHKKRLEDINILVDKDDDAAGHQQIRDRLLEAERIQHEENVGKIGFEKADEIRALRISLIADEEEKVRQRYDLEIQQVQRTEKDQEIANLKVASLRKEQETEIAQIQIRNLDQVISNVNRLGEILHRAFGQSGDEFIQKMLAALQIALQIAKTIEEANAAAAAGKGGLDSPGSLISLATGALSILSLFQEGGPIGQLTPALPPGQTLAQAPPQAPGKPYRDQTPVERGSYVVSEKMATRYKSVLDILGASSVEGGIPGKDSVPVRTEAGPILAAPGERILPPHLAPLGQLMNIGALDETKSEQTIKVVLAKYQNQSAVTSFVRDFLTGATELFRYGRPIVLDVAADRSQRVVGEALMGESPRSSPGLQAPAFLLGGAIPGAVGASTIAAYAAAGLAGQTVQMSDLGPVVDELRTLRAENAELRKAVERIPAAAEFPSRVKVDLDNAELFLRTQMETYEKFKERKQVG